MVTKKRIRRDEIARQSNEPAAGTNDKDNTTKMRVPHGMFIKFDPSIARECGIDAALIIGLIHFRSRLHAPDIEGVWVRLTQEFISEWLPRSKKCISHVINSLVDKEILSRRQPHSANRAYEYQINPSVLNFLCPHNVFFGSSSPNSNLFCLQQEQQSVSKEKPSCSASGAPRCFDTEDTSASYIKEINKNYIEDKESLRSLLAQKV